MYKVSLVLLYFIFLFSCVTKGDSLKPTNDSIRFVQENISLKDFSFFIDSDKSVKNNKDIYDVLYTVKIILTGKNYNFKVKYRVLDIEGTPLYTSESQIPFINNEAIITGSFTDNFLHNYLRCELLVEYKGEEYTFSSEYTNDTLPGILEFSPGPVITAFSEESLLSTALNFNFSFSNSNNLEKLILIPPSQNQYWKLPIETEDDHVIAKGSIIDNEHKDYISNGKYILQIHYGKYGIIEKTFNIIDFFNNESGPNYGLSPAIENTNEKNNIVFDIQNVEKIDLMEIIIYDNDRGRLNKMGVATITVIHENIAKKSLFKSFVDDFGNNVKLKYNKPYYYEVYLYSKEFNNIKYMSKSKMYTIEFSGFNFINF